MKWGYAVARTKLSVKPMLQAYEEKAGRLGPDVTDEERAEFEARVQGLLTEPLQEEVRIHKIAFSALPADAAERPTADHLVYLMEIGMITDGDA
jgi:hypothetical protein